MLDTSLKPIALIDVWRHVSACQMQKNLSVLTCSWHVNQWNFNFSPEFVQFSIPLTCPLHVSNKKLRPATPIHFDVWRVVDTSVANFLCFSLLPDVCLTRQWYAFFLTDMWVTRHWSEFLLLTCRDTSMHAKCEKLLFDVWLTRQCYIFFVPDVWCTRHWSEFVKNLVFSYHWRVDDTSAKS